MCNYFYLCKYSNLEIRLNTANFPYKKNYSRLFEQNRTMTALSKQCYYEQLRNFCFDGKILRFFTHEKVKYEINSMNWWYSKDLNNVTNMFSFQHCIAYSWIDLNGSIFMCSFFSLLSVCWNQMSLIAFNLLAALQK